MKLRWPFCLLKATVLALLLCIEQLYFSHFQPIDFLSYARAGSTWKRRCFFCSRLQRVVKRSEVLGSMSATNTLIDLRVPRYAFTPFSTVYTTSFRVTNQPVQLTTQKCVLYQIIGNGLEPRCSHVLSHREINDEVITASRLMLHMIKRYSYRIYIDRYCLPHSTKAVCFQLCPSVQHCFV